MPKVSIIVPVYNVEQYLGRCMNSLLNQTLSDIEIILIDDGSTDECPMMCDNYAHRDLRIKVVHKKNAGSGFARNSGIELAVGEYVGFVDSDDFVHPDMFKRLYELAICSNSDAVFSGCFYYGQDGKIAESCFVKEKRDWHGDQIKQFRLDMVCSDLSEYDERKYGMSVWRVLYKNSLLKQHNIRFVSERKYASEDIVFQIDFLSYANDILYTPECLYYYCENGTSLSHTFKSEKFYQYKALRSKLQLILDDDDFLPRLNRLFFLEFRAQVLGLMASKYDGKLSLLKTMINDGVWDDRLKHDLRAISGPVFQRIFAKLIVVGNAQLLALYSILYLISKKMVNKIMPLSHSL